MTSPLIPQSPVRQTRRELRQRVRRTVMLRRLRRELSAGNPDFDVVLRRPGGPGVS